LELETGDAEGKQEEAAASMTRLRTEAKLFFSFLSTLV